jgi:hypothetical protein
MEVEVTQKRELALGRRAAIVGLQHAMQALPTEGVVIGDKLIVPVTKDHFPVKHHFAPYSYGREMFLPKDSAVVGQIHKHAHVNVISQGRVRVFTEQEGALELTAPLTFVSSPGTKRAVEVLEDTIWTTFHVVSMKDPTLEDLPAIAQEVIATDFQEEQT